MQTSFSFLVGIVTVLFVCTNVCWAQNPELCSCFLPCRPITSCPKGLVIGYSLCGCCQDCVIPEGGYCSTNQPADGNLLCERALTCCRGVCSSDCEQSITDSASNDTTTTESTSTTDSTTSDGSTSTTETTTTEENTSSTSTTTDNSS